MKERVTIVTLRKAGMWTQHWSRKAEAAVIKQARQESEELQDNRPAKHQEEM